MGYQLIYFFIRFKYLIRINSIGLYILLNIIVTFDSFPMARFWLWHQVMNQNKRLENWNMGKIGPMYWREITSNIANNSIWFFTRKITNKLHSFKILQRSSHNNGKKKPN